MEIGGGGGGGGITPPCFWNGNDEWNQRAEDFVGKFLRRKHSSDSTLFFIPIYDIHKHVSNVFLRGYMKKYSSLKYVEVKLFMHVKGGKQKLSNMNSLVKQVIRSAGIANRHYLVVWNWSPRKVMYLYLGVSIFFAFPCLSSDEKKRY